MDNISERAGSFSVNDPDLEYSSFLAFSEIFGYQIFDFLRPEGVQIQYSVDQKHNGFIFCQFRLSGFCVCLISQVHRAGRIVTS